MPLTGFTGTEKELCELYVITLMDSTIVRFTSHDQFLEIDGYPFPPIPVQRGLFKFHPDLQVDRVDVTIGIVGVKIGNNQYSIPQVIRRDWLREANVKIYTYNWETMDVPDWDSPRWEGFVSGDLTFSKGVLTMNIASILDKLQDKFPKCVYTEQCNHSLFDIYCGLSADDYKESSAIGTNSTTKMIYSSIFAFSNHAEGWWIKGEIKITDADALNYNVSRMITEHGDGWIKVVFPFPESINVGETFDAWPGCDLTGVTCDTKFNNYANSLLFEYIPKPDTLFSEL